TASSTALRIAWSAAIGFPAWSTVIGRNVSRPNSSVDITCSLPFGKVILDYANVVRESVFLGEGPSGSGSEPLGAVRAPRSPPPGERVEGDEDHEHPGERHPPGDVDSALPTGGALDLLFAVQVAGHDSSFVLGRGRQTAAEEAARRGA